VSGPGADLACHWPLDPRLTFLNHGSFGACPRPVLDAQQALRERMEREPVRFLGRQLERLLAQARAELAAFIGADADDLAFVPNATTGVNTVLRSLPLEPGDEVLTTDHAYRACRNAIEFATRRAAARMVVAAVPFPIRSPDDVVEAIMAPLTRRTRLAVLDHVTSPTGVVFPIDRLVALLRERGVDTLVDGAHGPGMLALDVGAIGATYYVGNCHKWLCAPKGAAFLHVRRARQTRVRPLSISHGFDSPRRDRSRFGLEFDWTGTVDPTPYLCVPAAIRFLGTLLPGGWPDVRSRNREIVLGARRRLGAALGERPSAPEAMIGWLASLPLPAGYPEPAASGPSRDPLQDALFDRFAIEVPVIPWPRAPGRLIRVSAHLYNRTEQYDRLARALTTLLAGQQGPSRGRGFRRIL
jgi:isopenicillin-N epimerase